MTNRSRVIPPLSDADRKRFIGHIVADADGHWFWDRVDPRIQINGSLYLAKRVSYWLYTGVLSPDLYVVTTCDELWCINPAHLAPSTKPVKPDRQHRSLTPDQVREIRRRFGSESPTALAREFGYGVGNLYALVRGDIYGDVE